MALTERQRRAILNRDDHTNQMIRYDEGRGWHNEGLCGEESKKCKDLHVHHITSQRVGRKMGWTREQIDDPRNLLTGFKCLHVGICDKRKIKE